MGESTSGPDLFNQLADEFAERYRQGERPSLSEYTDKYPDLSDQIRELFPALVVIEQFGSGGDQATGSVTPGPNGAARVPEQLGDYRILREIARGGMGVVYEAIQESLGRHVALKVLPHHRLADPTQLERFQREARAAAMLHHTNIVPVFGVGEHDGVHYYAMQYIQGQSLDAVLHEVKRLRGGSPAAPAPGSGHDPALAASVAAELVSGRFAPQSEAPAETESLSTLRRPRIRPKRSLDHGPGNEPGLFAFRLVDPGPVRVRRIPGAWPGSACRWPRRWLTPMTRAAPPRHQAVQPAAGSPGDVWVTDFGLAKAEGTDELTHTGDLVGTLRYMAPERFEGQADARGDVYAPGADPVRDADAAAGVSGRAAGPADRADPPRRSATAAPARPADRPRPGDDRAEGDGEGAGRPLRDGRPSWRRTCGGSWPTGRSGRGGSPWLGGCSAGAGGTRPWLACSRAWS